MNQISYRISYLRIMLNIIFSIAFAWTVLLLINAGKDIMLIFTSVILLLYLTFYFFSENLYLFSINKKERTVNLYTTKYFFKRKLKKYHIDDISTKWVRKTGAIGLKTYAFELIYKNNNPIVAITSGISGWGNRQLERMAYYIDDI